MDWNCENSSGIPSVLMVAAEIVESVTSHGEGIDGII